MSVRRERKREGEREAVVAMIYFNGSSISSKLVVFCHGILRSGCMVVEELRPSILSR